jgi:hypothetical protein
MLQNLRCRFHTFFNKREIILMTVIKQEIIETLVKLPDTAGLEDILTVLEKFWHPSKVTPKVASLHPVDACYGTLGTGRRTKDIMAELRDEL